jgi:hypothetical protein
MVEGSVVGPIELKVERTHASSACSTMAVWPSTVTALKPGGMTTTWRAGALVLVGAEAAAVGRVAAPGTAVGIEG